MLKALLDKNKPADFATAADIVAAGSLNHSAATAIYLPILKATHHQKRNLAEVSR